MASARRPSSDVGAGRYSSSPPSAVTRSPALTLSASCSIVGIIKPCVSVERRQADLAGVSVERPEPFEFLRSQIVPDIVAQVLLGDRLPGRIVRVIRTCDAVGVGDTGVTRALQQDDLFGGDRGGPARPYGIDKRKAGGGCPQLAKVDL